MKFYREQACCLVTHVVIKKLDSLSYIVEGVDSTLKKIVVSQ